MVQFRAFTLLVQKAYLTVHQQYRVLIHTYLRPLATVQVSVRNHFVYIYNQLDRPAAAMARCRLAPRGECI